MLALDHRFSWNQLNSNINNIPKVFRHFSRYYLLPFSCSLLFCHRATKWCNFSASDLIIFAGSNVLIVGLFNLGCFMCGRVCVYICALMVALVMFLPTLIKIICLPNESLMTAFLADLRAIKSHITQIILSSR